MSGRFKNNGFTLIEIVIAVAIFGVIASIVFPALLQFLEMRERVVEKNNEVIELQKTFLFLANDLRFAANRLSKDEYGDLGSTTISIGDDSVLDFTAFYPDISLQGLGVPRRVRWEFDGDVLTRLQFPVMDPDADTRRFAQSLLAGVDDINIQVHHIEDGRDRAESRWQGQQRLPDLIDIEITMQSGVKYRRLFTMLGGDASQLQAQLSALNQASGGQSPRGQSPRDQAPRDQAPRDQAPGGQAPGGQAPENEEEL